MAVVKPEDYEKYMQIKQFAENLIGNPDFITPPTSPVPSQKRCRYGFGLDTTHINVQTPKALYNLLNKEFEFDHDPCPLNREKSLATIPNGLNSEWGKSNFVNPPFKDCPAWIKKSLEEWKKNKTVI